MKLAETCLLVFGGNRLKFSQPRFWAEAPNRSTVETKQSTWSETFGLVVVSGSSLSRLKAEAALLYRSVTTVWFCCTQNS